MLFRDNLISHLGEEQGQLEASGSTAGTLISLHLANRVYNEVLLHDFIFFLMLFFPPSVRCDRGPLLPIQT